MSESNPIPAAGEAILSPAYWAYHQKVIAEIRKVLWTRWPPGNQKQQIKNLDLNLKFFNEQCTYDEAFADGRDPADVAEEEVEAAIDSQ